MIRRLHRNGFVLLSAGPFNDLIYGEVGYVSCFEPSRSRSRPGNKLRSANGHRLMELKTINMAEISFSGLFPNAK